MDEKCKKLLAKYGITSFIGISILLFVLVNRGFFDTTDKTLRVLYLADAFTIPGVLILMIGVMMWISKTGIFDGITYALGRCARALVPFNKTVDERFYDYKVRKQDSRSAKDIMYFFVVGGAMLLVAVVFTIVHSVM